MKYGKTFLRKKFLLQRKKRTITINKFNFNLILKLIKKRFRKKKINIAAYYPVNREVNILSFLIFRAILMSGHKKILLSL